MTSSETAVQDARRAEVRSDEIALSRQATNLFEQNPAEAFLQRVQNTLAGRTLEAQGVLPTLTFLESEPRSGARGERAAERSSERHTGDRSTFSLPESEGPATPRRWTVAINLSSSGSIDIDGERRPIGADGKVDQILALAERTRDTPVTLYVQATLPVPMREGAGGSFISEPGTRQVATYRIENGEVTMLERQPTQGAQRDIERLLERASQRAGDGSLGLILQSHGFAAGGIGGDSGRVTLPQLEGAITNGLRASGRTAVDVLNFDSCSMGDLNVMQAMHGEARNIVGSAELERAFGADVDGQNMRATLGALLDNPSLTPEQYAARSIELARAGSNDDAGNVRSDAAGTETLAHFDQSRFPQFASSLDRLGVALTEIARDPARRAVMLSMISEAHALGDEGPSTGQFSPERRDLGAFLDGLDRRFADGSLGQSSPEISDAIRNARQELRNFVREYHGEPYNGYNRMSGLAVFLPTRDLLNIDDYIRANSPSGIILNSIEPDSKQSRFEFREDLTDYLGQLTRTMSAFGETSQMEAVIGQIRESRDEATMRAAVTTLRTQVEAFQASSGFQRYLDSERAESLALRDRVYDEQLQHVPPQWRGFLDAFRGR